MRKDEFNELLLLLQQYFWHEVHRHDYIEYLLPFYFEKEKMFRHINYSGLVKLCSEVKNELLEIHHSETELLPEKNYGMITLHGRFTTLNQILVKFLLPNFS